MSEFISQEIYKKATFIFEHISREAAEAIMPDGIVWDDLPAWCEANPDEAHAYLVRLSSTTYLMAMIETLQVIE